METSQTIAVTAQRPVAIGSQNQTCSIQKKIFAASLANTDTWLEQAAAESIAPGTYKRMDPNELLRCEGVTQNKSGIFIDTRKINPIIHSGFQIVGGSAATPTKQCMNEERIAVIQQMCELGCRIIVLDYGVSSVSNIERVKRHVRVFKLKPPIIGQRGKTKECTGSVAWTRDMWQKFEGIRISHFTQDGENPAGEGGMSVPINDRNTIISEKLRDVPIIRMFSRNGHRFYFMKDGLEFKDRLSVIFSKETYMTTDHADLFVGAVANIILVDRSYCVGENKTLLRRAARENAMKLLFVPEAESRVHPSNFLILEPNRILIDSRAVKTIELLRQEGVDAIPTAAPLHANMSWGGGVRCFINEL